MNKFKKEVEDGKIKQVCKQSDEKVQMMLQDPAVKVYDFKKQTIVPGFIDMHTHGGVGVDFIEPSLEKVESVYNNGYQYGCKDVEMKARCKTHCIYYQRKDYDIEVKDFQQLQKKLEERMSTDFSGKTIDLSKILSDNKKCYYI